MIPIYTLDKHLIKCGEIGEKYKLLNNIYTFNKFQICDFIDETDRYFSFYSCHDSSHSETIVSYIESLLGEEGIKQLSPTDTFLLLLAVYLHDFGMSLQYKEIKEVLDSGKFNEFVREKSNDKRFKDYTYWFKDDKFNAQFFHETNWPLDSMQCVNILLSEYYRTEHGDNSEKKINEQFKDSSININPCKYFPERLEFLLGRICSLHTKNFSKVMELDYEANGAFNDKVHPRFIAVLLRLGDLLDLDNNRFSESKLSTICDDIPEISKVHYNKHKSVKSFLITPQKINIVAESDDDLALRDMRNWVNLIEGELINFSDNWNEIVPSNFIGTIPKLIHSVKKNNAEIVFAHKNLKVSLPEQKAFQIIQGSNIYKHNLIFIREFIQNSLDALKIQFFIDDLQSLDEFDVKKTFKNEDDKIEFITEKYYNNELEYKMRKYGINIRLYDCRKEEELEGLEGFRFYYNSKSYKEKYFKNKIIVVVEDNGTGISLDNFSNRVLRVGEKDKKEDNEYNRIIKKIPAFLRPTGTFGIGLHSGFLATDKMIIHTRTAYDQYKGREIIIESGTDTGYVQCNVWNKEEEKRNTINRGTQIIVAIEPERIIVDEKYTMSRRICEFPFGGQTRDYLIEYIINLTSALIVQPFFDINIYDYKRRLISTIEKRDINLINQGESVFKKCISKNGNSYVVEIIRGASSKKEWYLTVEDRENSNILTLEISDCWEKERKITTLYKGILLESTRLNEILKRYLINGSKAIINYNFKDTSQYITINRDNVTKKGIEVFEKEFETLMYIGIEQFYTFLKGKYKDDKHINSYINARRVLEPIVEEVNKQFGEFISKSIKEKEEDLEFEFIYHDENWKEEIQKLLELNPTQFVLEVFIKLLACKMWDNRKNYEQYVLQADIWKYVEILYNGINQIFRNVNFSDKYNEFLNEAYIRCLFETLCSEIGGYAFDFLEGYRRGNSRAIYKDKDGKSKRIELIFKMKIPALCLFLYHLKYAQISLLDSEYKNILEVMADKYIYGLNYGHYSQDEENVFKDTFIYRFLEGNLKPIKFGSEAICYMDQLYISREVFFHEEKGYINAIYPIENFKLAYMKRSNNQVIESDYYTQIYSKKTSVNKPVFIKADDEVIKNYLFSDIIEIGYIDVEEEGACYFKEKDMYCMPATDRYFNIGVSKMPFEFEKCYKESRFKYINQNNYIMVPVDKKMVMQWGDLFEYLYKKEANILVEKCKQNLLEDKLISDIQGDVIYEYYTQDDIDIYKMFVGDCKEITESNSFRNIVEYTLKNRSYESEEKEEIIREKIKGDYLMLLKDIFIHIIDFFF